MVRVSEEQKKIIRQSIIEVSKSHFLEKGFDKTRTKDIAKEVGIAEGTVFNYFDTKMDIFLEAMAAGYITPSNVKDEVDYTEDIVDLIFDVIYKTVKPMSKLPKRAMKEMASVAFSMANKKPELLRKIIELDYNLIDDLQDIINKLIAMNRMKDGDAKMIAEVLYSVSVVEMVLYVYEDEISQKKMLENVKEKLRFTLQGHIL